MRAIGVMPSEDHNGSSRNTPVPEFAASTRDYRITERPLGTKRKLKVIILGAGVSGISFSSALRSS
ncbi:hypothetical protein LPUS_00453 [Lasallia pustulata]|uniref:Uncharacterized protein n=1 Tax=Lasallia pustulata TaxID=136370 RepID=A0A1W5CRS8_9LECA|nr:hypothetical protein LPUS_00453 [Lasallia pustulata]